MPAPRGPFTVRLREIAGKTPPAIRCAGLAAIALALTFLMIRGTVYPFDGLTRYRGREYSDVGQMVWNLWSTTESILALHSPLTTDLVYHPLGADLSTHTLSSGYFPIPLLAKLVTLGSPMYPIYAYNVTTLLSYAAILLFSFLALREVGFGVAASSIPAAGYAFCDFFALHWLHFNHLAGFTLPLATWLAIRLWKRPTAGRLFAVAVTLAWSVYLTEFALSICIAALLFLLAALAAPVLRRDLIARMRSLGAPSIALAVAFFCLAVAPFVISFFRSDALAPPDTDFHQNSANLAGFVVPSVESTPLYGDLFAPLAQRITLGRPGVTTFVGYPLLLFLVVGLLRQRRAIAWIALLVALFFYALSLGPTLKVLSIDTGIRMPYAALMETPPFDQNRCPARFSAIGLFFLLFGAAAGIDWIVGALRRRFHAAAALAFAAAAFAWTLAECWAPPHGPHEPYAPPFEQLARLVPGPVAHTSMPSRGCNDALLQVFHGHPIANGCLARTTVAQREHMQALRASFGRDWDAYARHLRDWGFKNIIVDRRYPPQVMEAIRALPFNVVELDE
jgi:hypothetical protein